MKDLETTYELIVNDNDTIIVDEFDRKVGGVYLWGDGEPKAIWILYACVAWTKLSTFLFGNIYCSQMQFKRREEAIQHIEQKLKVKRTNRVIVSKIPLPGKTVWETEDEENKHV